jgi:hypothetical protein
MGTVPADVDAWRRAVEARDGRGLGRGGMVCCGL